MKRLMRKRIGARIVSLALAAAVITGGQFMQEVQAADKMTLNNPVIEEDSTVEGGQKVTWDCIYLGSYPQTEIKTADSEYDSLKNAKKWDSNGETVIDGIKYRRMLKGDAVYAEDNSGGLLCYDWKDSTTYHYFRYEPIKWRVLKTDGKSAMLLSDIALDTRNYTEGYEGFDDIVWENSTIRSWLNGYSGDANISGISYSGRNFINSAFNTKEQSAIMSSKVVNNVVEGDDSIGGNDTTDKIFLLSYEDVCSKKAVPYGFLAGKDIYDGAKKCYSSDYAKAMGAFISAVDESCYWGLRTPFSGNFSVVEVEPYGNVDVSGFGISSSSSVRVALNLSLKESGLYTYAGTVTSDGIEQEPVEKKTQILKVTKSFNKTYGDKAFKLNAKLTEGNGALKYSSSDKKVVSVDKVGNVMIKGTGICTITVTADATNDYKQASANITITVNPKKNTLSGVKATGSRKLSVSWKKDTRGTGYELQYSTDKKFAKKKTTTVDIKNNKTTSYKISKLTKGKKYYVRVRTYKAVKVTGKTKKLYGNWSAVKQSSKIK